MTTRITATLAAGGLALAALATTAAADEWRPSQPVTMVVGFAAGGPVDTVGREVAQRMSEYLGQPVVVENVGGAGGLIAANRVVQAAPDGHTMFFAAAGNVVIRPLVDRDTSIVDQLDFVSLVSSSPHVMVVPASSPFETVGDLVEYARENPGELNFASAGTGAAAHLGLEMLKLYAGIDIEHIPYAGVAPSLVDVASGAVDGTLSSMPSLVPMLDAGQIRILGVSNDGPNNRGAPLIAETVENFGYTVWYGALVPAGTPREAIDALNAAIHFALSDEDMVARFAAQNNTMAASTPEEMAEFFREDQARWREVIEAADVRIE